MLSVGGRAYVRAILPAAFVRLHTYRGPLYRAENSGPHPWHRENILDLTSLGITVLARDSVSFNHVFQQWARDFDDYKKLGHIPVWIISQRMMLVSYVIGNHYLFEPPAEGSKEPALDLVFIRGQSWEFLPGYYRHLAPGRGNTVIERLRHIGNTSWVSIQEVRDSPTNELMIRGILQRINVSAIRRRPEPLPDWLKERYSYLTSSVSRPPTVQVFDEPTNVKCFRYSVVVAPSETDTNNHTFHASYLWYCMDCATVGARGGAYSVLRGNLAKFDLKMLEVLYQKESLEGDVLDIESWEDQSSPDTLRFQVKKGNENITQLTMQFYLPTA
ncbi:uncharacterized protein LOC144860878 isoform X2 [Branchiostoma floridae x Branchiostoma japonicum]